MAGTIKKKYKEEDNNKRRVDFLPPVCPFSNSIENYINVTINIINLHANFCPWDAI
jgi:hypothetical protein